jgi:hypothetical protein
LPQVPAADRGVDTDEPDALREAVRGWCIASELRFTVAAQLRTDRDRMPIEDAHQEWPEELSPYARVGEIVFPAQDPFDPPREERVNRATFSPWKGVEDHRPLGAIMRARRYVYELLGQKRLRELEAGEPGNG